jgi:capsid protein
MTELDKEARANVIRIRSGQATVSEVIREQGHDPEAHLAELADDFKRLDKLGLVLDCDPRKVSQTGQAQQNGGAPQSDGEEPAAARPAPKNGAAKGATTTPAA